MYSLCGQLLAEHISAGRPLLCFYGRRTGSYGTGPGRNPSKQNLSQGYPELTSAGTNAVAPGRVCTSIPSFTHVLTRRNPGSEIPEYTIPVLLEYTLVNTEKLLKNSIKSGLLSFSERCSFINSSIEYICPLSPNRNVLNPNSHL